MHFHIWSLMKLVGMAHYKDQSDVTLPWMKKIYFKMVVQKIASFLYQDFIAKTNLLLFQTRFVLLIVQTA